MGIKEDILKLAQAQNDLKVSTGSFKQIIDADPVKEGLSDPSYNLSVNVWERLHKGVTTSGFHVFGTKDLGDGVTERIDFNIPEM